MIKMDEDKEALEIRKKKLEELQKARIEEEKIKALMRVMLTENAYERLMNVKIANPQIYAQTVQQIIALYQQFRRKIDDADLIIILKRIKGSEKPTKIIFERK